MTPNRAGLTRFTPCSTQITLANGSTAEVHGYGSLDLTLLVGNDEILVRLKRVAYVPNLAINLFSTHSAIQVPRVEIKHTQDAMKIPCYPNSPSLVFNWDGAMYYALGQRNGAR
ncbi:unnamed protein product, partial [Discosporangium mesarthrocarpum]